MLIDKFSQKHIHPPQEVFALRTQVVFQFLLLVPAETQEAACSGTRVTVVNTDKVATISRAVRASYVRPNRPPRRGYAREQLLNTLKRDEPRARRRPKHPRESCTSTLYGH